MTMAVCEVPLSFVCFSLLERNSISILIQQFDQVPGKVFTRLIIKDAICTHLWPMWKNLMMDLGGKVCLRR